MESKNENNEKPLVSWSVCATVGKSFLRSMSSLWAETPISKLEIYRNRIELTYNFVFFFPAKKIIIKKEEIDYFEPYQVITNWVRVFHHNPKEKPFIIFGGMLSGLSAEEILKKLKESGYKVKN